MSPRVSAMCAIYAEAQIRMKVESRNLKLPMLFAFRASLAKIMAASKTPANVKVSAAWTIMSVN